MTIKRTPLLSFAQTNNILSMAA